MARVKFDALVIHSIRVTHYPLSMVLSNQHSTLPFNLLFFQKNKNPIQAVLSTNSSTIRSTLHLQSPPNHPINMEIQTPQRIRAAIPVRALGHAAVGRDLGLVVGRQGVGAVGGDGVGRAEGLVGASPA